jgi:hypothetical protein
MILPVARQEGHADTRVRPDPRRIARRAVRRDEEPHLLLLQLEGVAEGGSSNDSDERGGHCSGRQPIRR